MKKHFLCVLSLLLLFVASSCDKSEGEGGKSSIVGQVYKIIDDGEIVTLTDGTFSFAKDTIVAADEDVYIIYGNNQYGYDDKTKTSFDGTFRFEYLREGNYTVFAYTDLPSDEKEPVTRSVTIGKDSQSQLDDIYIYDGKNVGKCGVTGKIYAFWKDATSYQPGVALRVYLQEVGSSEVKDTRADANGSYSFSKLDPNSQYIIYAEDEPEKNAGIKTASISFTTGEAGTISQVEDLNVIVY